MIHVGVAILLHESITLFHVSGIIIWSLGISQSGDAALIDSARPNG
jgi:hypothetical protein